MEKSKKGNRLISHMSVPLLQLSAKPRFASGSSIERCKILLKILKLDPTRIKSIGITGSNGKGSTAHILGAMLATTGKKIGLFTSPHFISPVERFKINGRTIEDEDLASLAREVLDVAQEVERNVGEEFSRFEILTVMAFLYFQRNGVEISVLEAGMGGRLDPTRLAAPQIAGISSLELEHTDVLGDTLEEIFREKLLLLNGGGICFANIDADQIIQKRYIEIALKERINLKIIDVDYEYMPDRYGTSIILNNDKYRLPLLGKWQVRNFILALTLAKQFLPEFQLLPAVVNSSLRGLSIAGRFEKVCSRPEVYIDSAHTPDALKEVVNYIEINNKKGVIVLLGLLKNKPVQKLVDSVASLNAFFFISNSSQGGADPNLISIMLKAYDKEVIKKSENLEEVLDEAMLYALNHKKKLFVLGSLAFGAEVGRLIRRETSQAAIHL